MAPTIWLISMAACLFCAVILARDNVGSSIAARMAMMAMTTSISTRVKAWRPPSLRFGEASVAIAAASPHRGDAYAACRYAIERVKQIAPIWKREFFDGGDVWIEGATDDPDNAEARAQAERVACA